MRILSHFRTIGLSALTSVALLVTGAVACAGSATWNLNPVSNDWNTAGNWTPATVPNGARDIASMDSSNTASISLSAPVLLREIDFTATAPAYSITSPAATKFTFKGAGISNASGLTQNFALPGGSMIFRNTSGAGTNTFFETGNTTAKTGGMVQFLDSSNAGAGNFINHAAPKGGPRGGTVLFFNSATAAQGTFTNEGALGQFQAGTTQFYDTSTAGTASFISVGGTGFRSAGGTTEFFDSSSADHGTFSILAGSGGDTGTTLFHDTANGGSGTFFVGPDGSSGLISFLDNSSAGQGAYTGAGNSVIVFDDTSNAGTGTFTVTADQTSGSFTHALVEFETSANAGNAIFVLQGGAPGAVVGGVVDFFSDNPANGIGASGGNATFILQSGVNGGPGGFMIFLGSSTGGNARFELLGNSTMDITAVGDDGAGSTGITAGSIEGSGTISLGANDLTVGSNGLTTTFTGTIQDQGEFAGTGGSLIIVGPGILFLNGSNNATGDTEVNSGTLGGTGSVQKTLIIGTGTATPATLAPGSLTANLGTFISHGPAIFNSDGIYACQLNSNKKKADQLSAAGLTIASGAICNLTDLGNATLPSGTTFVIIHNAAAGAISGTFSNLPPNSTVTVGPNTYRVSYTGESTANSFTLTVP